MYAIRSYYGQCCEHLAGLFGQVQIDGRIRGQNKFLVLDKIAQVAVFFFSNGCFKGDGLSRDLENLAHLVQRDFHFFGNLFGLGLSTEFLDEIPSYNFV